MNGFLPAWFPAGSRADENTGAALPQGGASKFEAGVVARDAW